MSQPTDPRRKQNRRHLIFYLKVYDLQTGRQLGSLGDITTEGLMVVSKEALDVDKEWELQLRRQGPSAPEHTFSCRARSVWCNVDINPAYYATGFHILDRSPELEREIKALVKEIGFID